MRVNEEHGSSGCTDGELQTWALRFQDGLLVVIQLRVEDINELVEVELLIVCFRPVHDPVGFEGLREQIRLLHRCVGFDDNRQLLLDSNLTCSSVKTMNADKFISKTIETLSLGSLLWKQTQLYLRGRGGAKQWGTIIPVYNRHTHSKHIFQFTVDIHFQNALLLLYTKTAKARILCVHIICDEMKWNNSIMKLKKIEFKLSHIPLFHGSVLTNWKKSTGKPVHLAEVKTTMFFIWKLVLRIIKDVHVQWHCCVIGKPGVHLADVQTKMLIPIGKPILLADVGMTLHFLLGSPS